MKKKLTIVLPTYNRIQRLKKTLPIYLKTKRKDIEFLLINDCSTDDTKNFIKNLMKKDKRIKLINQKKNKHIFLSYIDGFKNVRTSYAMLLADDDFMIGDYINKCIEIFEENPSVGIIHNKVNKIKKNSKNDYLIYNAGEEAVRNIFMQGQSHPGLAFRMNLFNFDLLDKPRGIFGINIYAVDRINLDIAKKHDLAICFREGLIEMDYGRDRNKVLNEKKIYQRRTADYNIGELSLNKFELLDIKLFNEYCYKLSRWILNVIIINLSENEYKNFLKNISKTPLGKYHLLFFIRALYKRFDIQLLIYIIQNLFDTSLLKYHFHTLKFFMVKLLNALLKKLRFNKIIIM